ncbi:MAG: Calx-beta domain-containing protein [Pirellulales bacterium]
MVFRNVQCTRSPRVRMTAPRWAQPRMEPLERRVMLHSSTGDSTASNLSTAYQAALVDFHGPDLVGKDGPMARVGFDLTLLYEEQRFHQQQHPGTPFEPSSDSRLQVNGDWVTVNFAGMGDVNALTAQLTTLGMRNIEVAGSQFAGEIRMDALGALAAVPSLVLARPSYEPIVHTGSVQSQADAGLRADLARSSFGVDGSGVTVGILSDTFGAVPYGINTDPVQQDIATGDLPVNTQILDDLDSGTDEGRAMGQLVHDVAPGAAIQFATAFRSNVSFANNIRLLANSGSDVIVDDIGYLTEPFFQDGVIAQAVDDVHAAGIPYFSAAGNSGDESYESAFVNSGQSGGLFGSPFHDFDPGPGVSTLQQFNLSLGGFTRISFQWDQPYASLGGSGSNSDVDIFVIGADGTTILGGSLDLNVGLDPVEFFGFFNDGSFDLDGNGAPDTTFFIRIELFAGTAPGLMKYIVFGDGTIAAFDTNSSTSFGHPNAAGAMGVGAAVFASTPAFGVNPPLLNDFSSRGGTPILFDTSGNRLAAPIDRMSPQVTGVDGVNNTFFGGDISQDADGFPNFFGTSAAAPNVAAVAALMLQAGGGPSSLSPQTIFDALQSTAIDIVARLDFNTLGSIPIANGQGVDRYSGHGLVDAAAAIQFIRTQIIVQDIALLEGDSGITNFVFTVRFLGDTATPVNVAYTTVDDEATAPSDYAAASGTLTFAVGGQTTQFITVQVTGDTLVEQNEDFRLNISATNARVVRSQVVGTILNDDVDLSINDISIVEGNTGTSNAVFTVSSFGTINQNITVSYATADATARAALDYLPRNGALTFTPSISTRTITVPIMNDTFNEGTEGFFVLLSNAVNGRIIKGVGTGTIIDNDPLPGFYVNDVFVATLSPGVVGAVFTIALDNKSGREVTVHYATQNGTALANESYLSQSGDLTFLPGTSTVQVTVPIMGSALYESNERFFLQLSDPTNARLVDPNGTCTIIFGSPPPVEFVVDDGEPGFTTTGGWTNVTNLLAYQLDYTYHAAGNGSSTANWAFNDIPNGTYQVFTRWSQFQNRATNAPYTVFDGNTAVGTLSVNQQVAPAGDEVGNVVWQILGTYAVTTGSLRVRLTDAANGFVTADAVRIVSGDSLPQFAEMDVSGFDQSIDDGDTSPVFDDATDFGPVPAQSHSVVHTFTILNTGNATLHLDGSPRVLVSGAHASDFTVLSQPDFSVEPGESTTFDVLFHPTGSGLRQATVSIVCDDSDEPLYDFAVQGTGDTPGPAQFTIDDAGNGFHHLGDWVSGANTLAVDGDLQTSAAGNGADRAVWTFLNLAPGTYEVFSTWVPFSNRATNAPYQLSNGDGTTLTVNVNQQQAAAAGNGTSLGTIEVTNGLLEVTLGDAANGYVVADSVTIVRQGVIPAVQPVALVAHNAVLPQDVNADGMVSPIDAMIVINALIEADAAKNGGSATPQAATATSNATNRPQRFADVNDDGMVSPIDAMLVINQLIRADALAAQAASSAAPQVAAATGDAPAAAMVAIAVDLAIDAMDSDDSAALTNASDVVLVAVPANASAVAADDVLLLIPVAIATLDDMEHDAADDDADGDFESLSAAFVA